MAEVSLEMLQVLVQRALDELSSTRREVGDIRTVLLAVVDQGRRTGRRVAELRDDIELMVKAELMGRLGHFQTQMERRLEAIEARLPA